MIEFAPSKYQKVNKHPKFDDNFDIQRQLEHFKYEMNRTLDMQEDLLHFSTNIMFLSPCFVILVLIHLWKFVLHPSLRSLYLPCPSLYDLVIRHFFLHFLRKRRKKIQVRIIETRHAADSSSDSDEDSPPPPPPGSPKLYQTAEFVAKFACKAELKVAS